MPDTIAPLSQIDQEIANAKADLDKARADFDHCPSGDNKRTVKTAELRMNRLLERRYATRP